MKIIEIGAAVKIAYKKIKNDIERGFIAVGQSLSQDEVIANLKAWIATLGWDNYNNLSNHPHLNINGEEKELVGTVEYSIQPEPDEYLKSISKNEENKTIAITDKTGNITTFSYGGDKPYLSVRRLGKYLYEATFDSIPPYVESDNSAVGGCTTFVRDKKMYRSFDLTYDNRAEFVVVTKEFDGIALIQGLNDGSLDADKMSQLPYHLADGINRDGIKVSEHVLYNDFGFNGTGTKTNDLTKLPYVILTELHNMADITTNTAINNFLANCKIPSSIQALDYLLHFVVTDGTTTYNITPKLDGSGYEIKNISTVPKLANFKHTGQATVSRYDMNMQLRPNGIERFNSIGSTTKLKDLRFTKCYENPTMLSEFIGEGGTDKYSTDEELLVEYNKAHAEYLTRQRDGETWQSVHAVVYGANGIESLFVQEDYEKNFGTDTSELEKYVDKAAQYATQAGNSAVIAENAKDKVMQKFVECVSIEDYINKVKAGIIQEGYSLAFIREPTAVGG